MQYKYNWVIRTLQTADMIGPIKLTPVAASVRYALYGQL